MNQETNLPIEPDLEARIVALVLGEASDFETEELDRLIKSRPELAAFKREMEQLSELLGEVAQNELETPEADWQLSNERREVVLDVIHGKITTSKISTENNDASKPFRSRKSRWIRAMEAALASAVILVVLVGVIGLMLPAGRMRRDISDYFAKSETLAVKSSEAIPNTESISGSSATLYRADSMSVDFKESEPQKSFLSSNENSDPYSSALSTIKDSLQPSLDTTSTERDEELFFGKPASGKRPDLADNLAGISAPTTPTDGPVAVPEGGSVLLGGIKRYDEGIATDRIVLDSIEKQKGLGNRDLAEAQSSEASIVPGGRIRDDIADSVDPRNSNQNQILAQTNSTTEFGQSGQSSATQGYRYETRTRNVPVTKTRTESRTRQTLDGKIESYEVQVPYTENVTQTYQVPVPYTENFAKPKDESSMDLLPSTLADNDFLYRDSINGKDALADVRGRFIVGDDVAGMNVIGDMGGGMRGGGMGGGGMGGGGMGGGLGVAVPALDETAAVDNLPGVEFDLGQSSHGLQMEGKYKSAESEETKKRKRAWEAEDTRETSNAVALHSLEKEARTKQLNQKSQESLRESLKQKSGQSGQDLVGPLSEHPSGTDSKLTRGVQTENESIVKLNEKVNELSREETVREKFRLDASREQTVLDSKNVNRDRQSPSQDANEPSLNGQMQDKSKKPVSKPKVPSSGLNETHAANEKFSTFSLHVSDVSFKLAAAALARSEWPEAAKIRIEEFVNAFDYGDPLPCPHERVACVVEQAIHPFLQQRNVLRVSMRTSAEGRAASTPLRLTLVLDNSGSMERNDRQQAVRRALSLLARQLTPSDQVTLISFARQPRLLAENIRGPETGKLVEMIGQLPSEGGTNIEAALKLAFEKAVSQQTPAVQNRIVLLTDGAVNLGNADPESLSRMVESMRTAGIAFDAAGISADGLNDEVLEALTRKGDGRYYLLNSEESSGGRFAQQIAGALRPSASNVKVQVEFNPKRVGQYKLLGFEKHILQQEDFRNDAVEAAELAAAEAGVAMYQFEAKPDGEGDVGTVSVRFRDLATGQMIEQRWPIPYDSNALRPEQAAHSIRLATAAAMLAARLRGEALGESVDLVFLSELMAGLSEQQQSDPRVQQLKLMIEQARQLNQK